MVVAYGHSPRGGRNRCGVQALDHDFQPETNLGLFGIYLSAQAENFFCFTEGRSNADFIVDGLENSWSSLSAQYHPHTLLLNLDNGPENHRHRTQFIKRLVEFALEHSVRLLLAYYPPCHSKYNPVERIWGRLENHWHGELLDSLDKVLGPARSMTWRGKTSHVFTMEGDYAKGATLSRAEMRAYEARLIRFKGLEKYVVDIQVSPSCPFILPRSPELLTVSRPVIKS